MRSDCFDFRSCTFVLGFVLYCVNVGVLLWGLCCRGPCVCEVVIYLINVVG